MSSTPAATSSQTNTIVGVLLVVFSLVFLLPNAAGTPGSFASKGAVGLSPLWRLVMFVAAVACIVVALWLFGVI